MEYVPAYLTTSFDGETFTGSRQLAQLPIQAVGQVDIQAPTAASVHPGTLQHHTHPSHQSLLPHHHHHSSTAHLGSHLRGTSSQSRSPCLDASLPSPQPVVSALHNNAHNILTTATTSLPTGDRLQPPPAPVACLDSPSTQFYGSNTPLDGGVVATSSPTINCNAYKCSQPLPPPPPPGLQYPQGLQQGVPAQSRHFPGNR